MEIFQLSHWSLTSHGTFVVKCQFSALELCKQDQPHQRSITHQHQTGHNASLGQQS